MRTVDTCIRVQTITQVARKTHCLYFDHTEHLATYLTACCRRVYCQSTRTPREACTILLIEVCPRKVDRRRRLTCFKRDVKPQIRCKRKPVRIHDATRCARCLRRAESWCRVLTSASTLARTDGRTQFKSCSSMHRKSIDSPVMLAPALTQAVVLLQAGEAATIEVFCCTLATRVFTQIIA